MTDTTRWWLVRHAPIADPQGVILGRTDVDADLSDPVPLAACASRLPAGALWLTTGLRRARDTARRLAGDESIREDKGFLEQDFGDWEGASWEDIPARDSAAWWRAPATSRAPGGESFTDVVERVGAAMVRLSASCAGRDIVVIAHSGSICAALVHALGCGPEAGLAFEIAPLSLTRLDAIRQDGTFRWRVCGVNQPPI